MGYEPVMIVVTPHIYIEDILAPRPKRVEMKEEQPAPIDKETKEEQSEIIDVSRLSNESEYIEVRFQHYITEDFKELFIEQTKSKWFSQWFKCPAKKCKNYYLPTQLNNLKIHIREECFRKSHDDPEWWVDDDTLNMSKVKELFAIKKDKYNNINPKERNNT